jgi:hypothetical protein
VYSVFWKSLREENDLGDNDKRVDNIKIGLK